MRTLEWDEVKLSQVMEMIDRLAEIYEGMDQKEPKIREELDKIEEKMLELAGKTIEECQPFEEYWGYTSLETVAKRVLMPKVTKNGMDQTELKKIIAEILEHKVEDEAEQEYWIRVIAAEFEVTYEEVVNQIYSGAPESLEAGIEGVLQIKKNREVVLL